MGPNAFRVKQLKLKHKSEKNEFEERVEGPLNLEIRALPVDSEARRLLMDRYINESGQLRTRHRIETAALHTQLRNEVQANGGVNPDQEARNGLETSRIIREWYSLRRRIMRLPDINWDPQVGDYRRRTQNIINLNLVGVENIQRLQQHLHVVGEDYRHMLLDAHFIGINARQIRQAEIVARGEVAIREAEARVAAPIPNQTLKAFANDKQNVHTRSAVDQTKQNVEIIRQIFVPENYRWNLTTTSQTFRDIVYECDLSPKGNWQFAAAYCSDATIYEMEHGIYGIVTDGVWQFIRDSPDKACLLKILKTELEDNIGMCAQGNLSRMCNVLSGYLDGIGNKESMAEILGREFPKLMEIENSVEREARGAAILRENAVPEGEWNDWLEPLRA